MEKETRQELDRGSNNPPSQLKVTRPPWKTSDGMEKQVTGNTFGRRDGKGYSQNDQTQQDRYRRKGARQWNEMDEWRAKKGGKESKPSSKYRRTERGWSLRRLEEDWKAKRDRIFRRPSQPNRSEGSYRRNRRRSESSRSRSRHPQDYGRRRSRDKRGEREREPEQEN